MSVLSGKKIILGVSGGIAAYKSASLVRLFIKAGAHVQVIMTPASKDFVTPLTLSTLSKNPVHSSFFNEEDENAVWNNHVDLALWADYILIAPATANTMSKMVNGNCDNLLIATYLSAKCPVYIAPAMDLDMYKHPSTLANFEAFSKFGNTIIPAESGELASGLSGEGRMAEPENIIAFLEKDIESKLPLKGKKILITAGPTYEAIDPVRFIGNHSSGKMGLAIAEELYARGADVTLIMGPSSINLPGNGIRSVRVSTAEEMYAACTKQFDKSDIGVMAAAVADYTPVKVAATKVKKNSDELVVELKKTKDILKSLGENKSAKQVLVGFALETNNEREYALEKLKNKNADMIVMNSLNDMGAGFGTDTNKITIFDKSGKEFNYELMSKKEAAKNIVDTIIQLYYA